MSLRKKNEVIKHSAAIHIENKISLLQRKAWNVLLANAYDELPTQDEYTVNVAELNEVLGYDSRNDKHLKESVKALMTCLVEWDVLDKDGTPEWGATTLLAQVKIKSGICTYAYSPDLRRRLHNPKMYARINLKLQNKFKSKHALALYELCVDYLDMERHYGETPFIPLARFRELMGIPDSMYKDFKRLNQRVIREPIAEINEVSDFHIEVEYKRVGRKVVAVKFKIAYIPKISIKEKQQGELFVDTKGLPELVAEMVIAGVHRNKAIKIWSQGFGGVNTRNRPQQEFSDYVREKIDLLQQEAAKGNISDKGAWLVSAIRDDYRNLNYQKRKQVAETQERIAQLETEVKRLKHEQGKHETDTLNRLIADNDNLQAAFELVKTQSLFKQEWNQYADNIRQGLEQNQFFAACIRLAIKEKHLDLFKPANDYDNKIQKVEGQIRKLKANLRR